MKKIPLFPAIAAVALWAAASAAAPRAVFVSPSRPPHLLELYTSEGCSSCPPADLWFGELKTEPELWKNFIPVAYHVDYWDHLGWRDPMGSKAASLRQRRVAEAGKVYTPGFFLNGAEWRGWFDGRALPPSDLPSTGRITVTEVGPSEYVVDYKPSGNEAGPLVAHGTLLGMGIEVDVTAGENRGKHLFHDFVALGLRNADMSPSGGRFTATLKLSNNTRVEPSRLATAFWVTRRASFVPLQAAGGPLEKSE